MGSRSIPFQTDEYVQTLSKRLKVFVAEADAEVIQKHSGWVLKQDPEAALEVFVGAEKRLPPSVVLPILAEHVPQYSAVRSLSVFRNTGI